MTGLNPSQVIVDSVPTPWLESVTPSTAANTDINTSASSLPIVQTQTASSRPSYRRPIITSTPPQPSWASQSVSSAPTPVTSPAIPFILLDISSSSRTGIYNVPAGLECNNTVAIDDSLYTPVIDVPSNFVISAEHSKLIPYFAWRLFNDRIFNPKRSNHNLFTGLPTSIISPFKVPSAATKSVLSGTSTSYQYAYNPNRVNIDRCYYVNVLIGTTRKAIFVRDHIIYTYPDLSIVGDRVDDRDINAVPIILIALCSNRDQRIDEPFNLEKSVLVVNSDPDKQAMMRPFTRYIKLYKESGVKNILYTQDPNAYIFGNIQEEKPLMSRKQTEAYIKESLI